MKKFWSEPGAGQIATGSTRYGGGEVFTESRAINAGSSKMTKPVECVIVYGSAAMPKGAHLGAIGQDYF
ncbi:MAG: hypothetical protein KQH63_02895 [Desulfobulbaceae bacterium]|nr:hypothetical protein [Desulfobulbaceae bacterium]